MARPDLLLHLVRPCHVHVNREGLCRTDEYIAAVNLKHQERKQTAVLSAIKANYVIWPFMHVHVQRHFLIELMKNPLAVNDDRSVRGLVRNPAR